MSFQLDAWFKNKFGEELADLPVYDPASIHPADEREWLVTNGLGSYAAGSISGANTRRYHGHLVAALDPPTSRTIMLSRIDEHLNGENVSTNLWTPDVVNPRGYEKVVAFSIYPCPTWVLELEGGYLIKQIFMLPGRQSVFVGYSWQSKANGSEYADLDLHLIANFRDFHSDTHGDPSWRFQQSQSPGLVIIRAYEEAQALYIQHSGGEWVEKPDWYDGYFYPRELERGLSDREDCYHAGLLRYRLRDGELILLLASAEQRENRLSLKDAVHELLEHQSSLLEKAGNPTHPAVRRLVLASDAFVVSRKSSNSQSIIAGYHWFNDWGRDAMISLPGLTLATGRYEAAHDILKTFQNYLSEGMLPNNFPDAGQEPQYNTIDATLWWAWTLKKYVRATEDTAFVKAALPALESVVEHHVRGTRYKIKLDGNDGLLAGGADGVQLTWMDAKAGDKVFTPRRGKPVEVNALWYNFLRVLAEFKTLCGQDGSEYEKMAERTKRGFQSAFWNEEKKCLFDVINEDGSKDDRVRPNQILALSLQADLLADEKKNSILSVVETELLTPFGMRSLSPKDEEYKGRYGNGRRSANQYERDLCYHQGTVWAWLLGHWIDARMNLHGRSVENICFINAQLALLLHHHLLFEGCLGSVSEIFDGDNPHKAQGCVAQAWSVAELLRVFNEYPELQGKAKVLTAAGA